MAFSARVGIGKAAPSVPRTQPAQAPQRPQDPDFDSITRRQEELADARKKAAEDDARREAYEQEKARQATIARSKAEAARRAGGNFGDLGAASLGSRGGYAEPESASRPSGFGWKKDPAPQSQEKRGLSFGGSLKKPAVKASSSAPAHDICEQAVSAIVSRSQSGMREGLQMLGLPDYPLSFVPGAELVLCGHNIREDVNEMIHNWMTDEKDDFQKCLSRIKGIVQKPILNEEEAEMLDSKANWQKILGPDGRAQYVQRSGASAQEDDDEDEDDGDDEVIDITPGTKSDKAGGEAGRVASSSAASSSPAPADASEDHYRLLGVSPTTSLQEIRTRFRALVLTAHPEKGGDVTTFHKLNKAYGVLSDPKKRQEYDESRLE